MTKEIHFVTGKGGTGKSFVAAALALHKARQGARTLLIELGDRSFYKDFFGLAEVGYHPTPLASNLEVAIWNGTESLREYAKSLLRVEAVTRLFFENQVTRSLVEIAPGLPELAILGKITSGPRKHGPSVDHEVLVVDAFSTGHFLALMNAPGGLAKAVRLGPMGEQTRSIQATLQDRKLCQTHLVTLPEEMPLQETEELYSTLKSQFQIVPQLILNKVISMPNPIGELSHPFSQFLQKTNQRQILARQRLQVLGEGPWIEVEMILESSSRRAQEIASGAFR